MPITHDEARRLIHFNADQVLTDQEKTLLEDHLTGCLECSTYSKSIFDLESTLTSVMKRKWNSQPVPHPTQASTSSRHSKLIQSVLFATRITAMGVICVAFLFNIWQVTRSTAPGSGPSSASVPPVPTPSILSATTNVTVPSCDQISYTVRENDTLNSIAGRFSVPAEEILATNHLDEKKLYPAMNIYIPSCGQTPGTLRTATITYTPLLDSTTSTPVNGPTQ